VFRRFLKERKKRFFGQEEREGCIIFRRIEYVCYEPETEYVVMRDWKDEEYNLGPGNDVPVSQVLMEGNFSGFIDVAYPSYPFYDGKKYITYYCSEYFLVEYEKESRKLYLTPEPE